MTREIRREGPSYRYTHNFAAAVADLKRDLPHMAAQARRLVRESFVCFGSDAPTMPVMMVWVVRHDDGEERILEITAQWRWLYRPGWQPSGVLDSEGLWWGARCRKAAVFWMEFIDYDAMLRGLRREHGESCLDCGRRFVRGDRDYGDPRCRACKWARTGAARKAEREAAYWTGPGPWNKELPQMVRRLQQAAKKVA